VLTAKSQVMHVTSQHRILRSNITSDITNKPNELALKGSPGLSSSWFITIHITSDITNKKRGSKTQYRDLVKRHNVRRKQKKAGVAFEEYKKRAGC
jgi:hypothetical protein